jgi:hypothetical protein
MAILVVVEVVKVDQNLKVQVGKAIFAKTGD